MMRMIFIFGFAKKYLLEVKLHPIKDVSLPSRSVVHSEHRRKYKDVIKEQCLVCIIALRYPFVFLVMIWITSDLERRDASLIGRNFSSNKYFLANPKIKINRIIEINTLVAFVLRYLAPQRRNRKI